MNKKCGNCQHWGKPDDRRFKNEELLKINKCHRIPMFWDSTDWHENGHDRVFVVDSLAFTQDASDYRADLLTKAEFMCNMWEEKCQ